MHSPSRGTSLTASEAKCSLRIEARTSKHHMESITNKYKLLIGSAKTQLILPGMIMLRRSSSNYRSSRSKNELPKFISRVTQIWYKLTSISP